MTKQFTLLLDDGTGDLFDSALQASKLRGFPEYGDIKIITKDKGTNKGNPAVMIAFSIDMNGQMVPVQTVTTAKLFVQAAKAIEAKYGDKLK